MRSRRMTTVMATCVSMSLVAVACSSSAGRSATSSSLDSTSTDVSTTLFDSSSTSSSSVETSTSTTAVGAASSTVPPTVTTLAVGASINLREDGVGDALFGAEPEGVINYLKGLLGAPSSDTGWVSAPERTCPGKEVRNVVWGDLSLMFGDQSLVSTDRRHFFEWSYGPPAGEVISPLGMATAPPARIGIGSTVTQLRTAYPSATLFAGDELVGPSASITGDLVAFLTNTGPTGVVTSLAGGHGCGE